jgi:hypothetical protein
MPAGISHVSLATGSDNFDSIRKFYVKTLPFLDYRLFMKKPGLYIAMPPKGGEPDFWLHSGGSDPDKWDGSVANRSKTHLAFHAKNRYQVDAWYKAAM